MEAKKALGRVSAVAGSGLLMVQSAAAQGANSQLGDVVQTLQDIGVVKFVLPFLLMFAIVYGLLEKLDVFENDRVNAIVAVVSGLFVSFFVLQNPGMALSAFLVEFFGAFAIVAVFLMAVVMAAGLGGYGDNWAWDESARKAFFVLGALSAIAVFIGWGGLQFFRLGNVQDQIQDLALVNNSTFMALLVILLAAGLIYYVTGGEEAAGGGAAEGEQ